MKNEPEKKTLNELELNYATVPSTKSSDVPMGTLSPGSPKPLAMLSNIEIKKKLGSGSYGEVFLGNWNGF